MGVRLGCLGVESRKQRIAFCGGVMGNTCACIRSEAVSYSGEGGSMESGHDEIAPAAFGGECGSSHVGCGDSESMEQATGSGKVRRDVEERIESSKVHWSELTEHELDVDDEEVAQENKQVFLELQSHPTWGQFFKTFGYDTEDRQQAGELVVGEKFAEGGQAELFHAKVTWRNPKSNEDDLEVGREWVLKVFKKGTRLRELQAQWPVGYLQWWAQDLERFKNNLPSETLFWCEVHCGTLLQDGRFAFLMGREHGDLRSRIDCAMLDNGDDQGPFSKDHVEGIMFRIAKGMDWLHSHNIVHRDLKASNVLVDQMVGYGYPTYYVADFECSIGVVGTGFFRAPEILQALKDKAVGRDLKLFSKEADVYSYGMTCYEVLTGELPFQGHPLNDYDLVLNGQRPIIPEHVESWKKKLLTRCWDVDCSKRPLFPKILEILSSNSTFVRKYQLDIQEFEEDRNRKHEERLLQQHQIVKLE